MHSPAASAASDEDPEADPIRVLLVDPYGHSREALGASLRGGGLSVETAEGSPEAIQKMKDGAFDLAIVDLDMPLAGGAATGWALAKILRATSPGLALILITAECRPETRTEAGRHGAARLLEKPINPRELRSMVRQLCREAVQQRS